MNNHQLVPILLRCSKPSRWWQPPRVTRNLQPQRSPSATRCNHSSKCIRNHSQSHCDDESMTEINESGLLRLTRMSSMSKCQESEPQASHALFIDPLRQIESLLCTDLTGLAWSDAPQRLVGCVQSTDGVHVAPLWTAAAQLQRSTDSAPLG
jgi:hypothetical protein